MSALTARNVALTGQVLATLAGEGALPISAMALLAKLNAGQPEPALAGLLAAARPGALPGKDDGPALLRIDHADLLRVLNRLARRRQVEKIALPDMRGRYWRLDLSGVRL